MTALAESRDDLEGTLVNLADLTQEVGSLVEEHGDRLGRDLGLAAKITSAVLEQRASVEESLEWLPVVGKGFTAAYNPESRDIDVRDNVHGKLECELFDALPAGPIKDAFKEICREQTGEPGRPRRSAPPLPTEVEDPVLGKLDCDEGVRKVRRQLRRLDGVGLPDDVKSELIEPLEKQLRRLKRECKKLGEEIAKDPELLERLKEIGDIPEVDLPVEGLDDLGVSAASTPVPDEEQPSAWDEMSSWFGGFLSYIGVAS